MNFLVFHIASGQSFFSGATLLVIAAIASAGDTKASKRIVGLTLPVGVIAVAISSTPVPYWCYGVWGAAIGAWAYSWAADGRRKPARITMIAACFLAMLLEAPYHVVPELSPAPSRSLTVIGDSVTAGMGDENAPTTWPVIFSSKQNVTVSDYSHVGETAGSAYRRVKDEALSSAVCLVEIGGNDVLGSTSPAQFRRDLDSLLTLLASSHGQVVMFELPLPPFYNAYGQIQRSLARKHGVLLVPKRVFLSVIAGNGSTIDTIHLAADGHRAMADVVGRLLNPAFR